VSRWKRIEATNGSKHRGIEINKMRWKETQVTKEMRKTFYFGDMKIL